MLEMLERSCRLLPYRGGVATHYVEGCQEDTPGRTAASDVANVNATTTSRVKGGHAADVASRRVNPNHTHQFFIDTTSVNPVRCPPPPQP